MTLPTGLIKIRALAVTARDNQHDGVALNDYGTAMTPAVTIDMIDLISQLQAEVMALRPDAERYQFVLQSIEDEPSAPGIYFIEEDGRGMGSMLYGQEATDAIDAARGALGAVYRCHKCNDTTPPPAAGQRYASCACGAMTVDAQAPAGHPRSEVFGWLYIKSDTRDVQFHRHRQSGVESAGYTVTALYKDPTSGAPAGWAYRLARDPFGFFKFSRVEPSQRPGFDALEIVALYELDSTIGEVPAPPVSQTIEVWTEGYSVTGIRSGAERLGVFQARTLDDAVTQHLQGLPMEKQSYYHRGEDGVWTCWGCRLFDNEADARKSFG